MSEKSIEWGKLAVVWEHFEKMGLSPSKMHCLLKYIESPILIVGSGIGLVPRYLQEIGHVVTSIDPCAEMVEHARKRGISVDQSDIETSRYTDKSFSTVILSTGVVNTETLASGTAEKILKRTYSLLRCKGKAISAYFLENAEMEKVYDTLQLNVSPSNNALFIGATSKTEALKVFVESSGVEPSLLHEIFDQQEDLIEMQRVLVNKMAQTLEREGIHARDYISKYFSYKTYDLPAKQRDRYIDLFKRHFSLMKVTVIGNGDTEVIAGQKR